VAVTGWIIGLIALGALIATLLIVVGVEVTDALDKSPKSEGDTIAGLVTGAIGTFAAAIFTKDLEEGTGNIWPGAKTKTAMQDKFANVFKSTPKKEQEAHEAVFDDRLHEHPDVEGWGLAARLARAKIIATAL
jgi:hypothetical protein